MEQNTYYLLSLILSLIMATATIIGLVFTCTQLFQIKKNRKKQYEQSRREKTIDMVTMYINSINSQTKATENIVAQLTDDQCQDLYNGISFEVDEKIVNKMCKICPYRAECKQDTNKKTKCKNSKGEFVIEGDLLYLLRSSVINYLNTLECVLLSWQLGIVDQKTLEEQFEFLDKKRQKERALEVFRTIAGNGKSYPTIEKFYQYLDQKNNDRAKETIKEIIS